MDISQMKMYCVQCQETSGNTGCVRFGCCGKNPRLANMMDYMISALKGIAYFVEFSTTHSVTQNITPAQATEFVMRSLFMTITNANFDELVMLERARLSLKIRDELAKAVYEFADKAKISVAEKLDANTPSLTTKFSDILTVDAIERINNIKSADASAAKVDFDIYAIYCQPEVLNLTIEDIDSTKLHDIAFRCNTVGAISDADKRGVCELTLFGLKGMSAYLVHALNLGFRSEECEKCIINCLVKIEENSHQNIGELLGVALEAGRCGTESMLLLDKANTAVYGNPVVTEIDEYCVCPKNNLDVDGSVQGMKPLSEEQISIFTDHPTILVTGHDLLDLNLLLQEIEEERKNTGTIIKVLTHGEMLPTNAYPALNIKFKQYLVGNFGLSWWRQVAEFDSFPGCFLFTTNCIVPFKESCAYGDRIYTTGEVGCPGAHYVDNKRRFREVVDRAKSIFEQTTKDAKLNMIQNVMTKKITIGFAHNQVSDLKEGVLDAILTGKIKEFVVMSGCDGRHKSRSYYSKFASALPKTSVILTSGCAKYRYNMLELGNVGSTGIPRVLDAGQCNDSISLVLIAKLLAEELKTDISKLPLRFNIAWYEQKAVIVLLALLYNGIKNIRLGPTLPGFATPEIVNILVKDFGVKVIHSDAIQNDVEDML